MPVPSASRTGPTGDKPVVVPMRRFFPDAGAIGGFFISSICTAGLIAFVFGALEFISLGRDQSWWLSLDLVLLTFGPVLGLVLIAGLVVGLPLTLALSSNRMEHFWSYPAAGFLSGAAIVVFVVLLLGFDVRSGFTTFWPIALIGAATGAIYGAFWWLFYRRYSQDG